MTTNVLQIQDCTLEDLGHFIDTRIEAKRPRQEPPKKPRYYTRKEVAELHDVSLVTIDKWSSAGHLQKYRIGGKIRFKAEEVEQALEEVKNLKYKR